MQCANCKSEVPANAKFCNHCGAKIENQGKTCPNPECGRSDLPEEANFCPNCGTRFDTVSDELKKTSTSSVTSSFIETVNGVSFKMIWVDGGTFTMGATDKSRSQAEQPSHQVSLDGFFLAETLVTQDLWKVIVGIKSSVFKSLLGLNPGNFKGYNMPMENISWNDVQAFLQKLNNISAKNYRLPTEAEWEYAAGGGAETRNLWAGTDQESLKFLEIFSSKPNHSLNSYAWYRDNSGGKTHPVATKQPNQLGLFDMSGNVWEFCQDWFGSYSRFDQRNPLGPDSGTERVLRGGSWHDRSKDCRVTTRSACKPGFFFDNIGFRLAMTPKSLNKMAT